VARVATTPMTLAAGYADHAIESAIRVRVASSRIGRRRTSSRLRTSSMTASVTKMRMIAPQPHQVRL
jgi:hypothetical protein